MDMWRHEEDEGISQGRDKQKERRSIDTQGSLHKSEVRKTTWERGRLGSHYVKLLLSEEEQEKECRQEYMQKRSEIRMKE